MPAQISTGPFSIDSYTFCVGVGAILGIAWILAARLRNSSKGAPDTVSAALNGLLLVGIGSSVAGRLAYALIYIDYFRDHLAEIASAASPGYSEQAAILGGLAGWWLALRLARRLRLPVDGRGLVVLATLIGIGASLGCVSHGCAYGREVFWDSAAWIDRLGWPLRVDWPDAYMIPNPRLPAQLFLAGWLALCGVMALIPARWRQSTSPASPTRGIRWSPAALWIVLFATGDFALQFLRADPMPVIAGLRAAQWLDIVLWLAGCAGLAKAQ